MFKVIYDELFGEIKFANISHLHVGRASESSKNLLDNNYPDSGEFKYRTIFEGTSLVGTLFSNWYSIFVILHSNEPIEEVLNEEKSKNSHEYTSCGEIVNNFMLINNNIGKIVVYALNVNFFIHGKNLILFKSEQKEQNKDNIVYSLVIKFILTYLSHY